MARIRTRFLYTRKRYKGKSSGGGAHLLIWVGSRETSSIEGGVRATSATERGAPRAKQTKKTAYPERGARALFASGPHCGLGRTSRTGNGRRLTGDAVGGRAASGCLRQRLAAIKATWHQCILEGMKTPGPVWQRKRRNWFVE